MGTLSQALAVAPVKKTKLDELLAALPDEVDREELSRALSEKNGDSYVWSAAELGRVLRSQQHDISDNTILRYRKEGSRE